jgi:predicted PurR-regulated permease PerM
MNEPDDNEEFNRLQRQVTELAIRLGALFLIIVWCFSIIQPFILVMAWASIVAISLYPVFRQLTEWLGGHEKLVAGFLSFLLIAALAAPAILLTDSLVNGAQALVAAGDAGSLELPAPPDSVAEWALVGESVYAFWQRAATDLPDLLQEFTPQIKAVGTWALSIATGTGVGVVQFVVAFLIAGVLLATANEGASAAGAMARRLAGTRGGEFANLSVRTIRTVATGIVGVSIVQTALLSLGFLAIDLPAAGLLALVALVLAVVQIGPAPVAIPAIIYVFYTSDIVPAAFFAIWAIAMMLIDNVLKPLAFSRGAMVPTLIIFLGSIGGMLAYGIIGLFVGAIVLSLGYKLYETWLVGASDADSTEAAEAD